MSPGFDVTSVASVVFLLLVFFVVASAVISPGTVGMLLPRNERRASTGPLAEMVVSGGLGFCATFNGRSRVPVSLRRLPTFLREYTRGRPSVCITLCTSRTIPCHRVMEMLGVTGRGRFGVILTAHPPRGGHWTMDVGGGGVAKLVNATMLRVLLLVLLLIVTVHHPRIRRRKNIPIVLKGARLSRKGTSPCALASVSVVGRPRTPTPSMSRPRAIPPIRAGRRVVARARRRAITIPGGRPGGRAPGGRGPGGRAPGGSMPGGRTIGPGRGARTRGHTRTRGTTTRGGTTTRETTTRTTTGGVTNTFNGKARVKGGKANAANSNLRNDPAKGSSRKGSNKINNCKAFSLGKHSLNDNNLPVPICGIRSRKQIMIAVAMGPTKRIVDADVGGHAGAMGTSLQGTTRRTTHGTHFGRISKIGGRANAVACCFGLG